MREINMNSIRSIDRSIDILASFTHNKPTQTIDEIAKATKLPNSTVYRIICTFEKRGIIRFDPFTSSYTLGFKLIEFGTLANDFLDLPKIAEEDLIHLHNQTDQTVVMAVKMDDEILYVFNKEQNEGLKYSTRVGQTRPFNFGVLGPILLAFAPTKQIERVLEQPLTAHTKFTITDKKSFLDRLSQIQKEQLNIDNNETTLGVTGVGAPIFGVNNTVIAAIGIIGPLIQFEDRLEEIIEIVQATSKSISKKVGNE